MQTATDKTVLAENVSMLRLLGLRKPLVPIEEYAAREEVPVGIVEQCVKLGILQIRKCRGKTFVVDMPLSPHPSAEKNPGETTKPTDRAEQVKKIFELVRKATSQPSTKTKEPISPSQSRTIEKPPRPALKAQIKQPETVAKPEKKIEKTVPVKQKPATVRKTPEVSNSLESLLAAQAKSKRVWQVFALSSVAVVFILLFTLFSFYADYRVELSRFEKIYANIQTSLNEAGQTTTRAKRLQNELGRSNAELGRLRRAIERSRAQGTQLQSELDTIYLELGRAENELVKTRAQLENALEELAGPK